MEKVMDLKNGYSVTFRGKTVQSPESLPDSGSDSELPEDDNDAELVSVVMPVPGSIQIALPAEQKSKSLPSTSDCCGRNCKDFLMTQCSAELHEFLRSCEPNCQGRTSMNLSSSSSCSCKELHLAQIRGKTNLFTDSSVNKLAGPALRLASRSAGPESQDSCNG